MHTLQNKRILLGISGGIAAYKSAELVRQLSAMGASVRTVMTEAAQAFITPLTLQALSGNPVHTQLLDPEAEAGMGHIELARWADLVLIAPASADLLARLAQGEGSDLLTTLCLATPADIAVAPAMNQQMWRSSATVNNIEILAQRDGVHIWGPAEGQQACGDVGPGRMLEPQDIAARAAQVFERGTLAGKKVVITAGPTREAIDPVRYLSNHSSGKMGYALAEAAVEAGAKTVLISGPTRLVAPERVEFEPVVSAEDMLEASLKAVDGCDIFIAAAAVSDYRPREVASEKIKKSTGDLSVLNLVKNPDIVATIAAREHRPYTVGFAAETTNVVEYAQSKLKDKNLDLIIANDVSQPGIGFNSDENAVTVVDANESVTLAQCGKSQLARELITLIGKRIK